MGATLEIKQRLFSSSQKTETIQEQNSPLTSYTRVDICYLPKAYAGVPQTFLQKWVIAEQWVILLNRIRLQLVLVCATSLAGDHSTPSWQLQ